MSAADKSHAHSNEAHTANKNAVKPPASRSASASPGIKLQRKFHSNPFRDRALRCQFVTNRHDAILKQFSSTHFHIPNSSHQLLSPHTANRVDAIKNGSSEGDAHASPLDDSSSEEGADDIDVDDTEPYIFEFPYYLNSTKRNLVLMKEHFLQENRVDALKIAIQVILLSSFSHILAHHTSRFLIDDLVLSEPQFYPAIYVLVSKLLDSFGVLVYDRLYALTTCPSDSIHYEQNQHNFVPDAPSNDTTQTSHPSHAQKPKTKETLSEQPHNHEKAVYGNEPEIDYDDEKHQHFIQLQQQLDNENKEVFPENFRASHCSHLCQIKCANWFFKISAIRELVPRTLIEIALYRTLRFLYPLPKFLEYTRMLMKRLRGIANPLIAAYVRIFALEQIFGTFGVSSFNYDHDHEDNNDAQHQHAAVANTSDVECHFDMIEDIYLMVLEDVLFIFKSMYDTKFKYVDCVFYGQMASVDYLNLFNPIFEMIFDILKYNHVLENVHEIKLYLTAKIDHSLLKLIDLDSFLGIKKSDPYVLNLDDTKNVYNQEQTKKPRKNGAKLDRVQINHMVSNDQFDEDEEDEASEGSGDLQGNDKNHKLSDMAQNFQNHDLMQ